jgi:hypothetical protein
MGLIETAGSPKYRTNDTKPRLFCVQNTVEEVTCQNPLVMIE